METAENARLNCAAEKVALLEEAGLNILHPNPIDRLIYALRFYANASEEALWLDCGITARVVLETVLADIVTEKING